MEDILVQEDINVPEQQDPPLKKLYQGLYKDGKYTKSFDEFQKKYSTPDQVDILYKGLKEDGDYTKGDTDFYSQYFPEVKKKEKTTSNVVSTSSDNGSKDVESGVPFMAAANGEDKTNSPFLINNNPQPEQKIAFKQDNLFGTRRLRKGTPAYDAKVKEMQSHTFLTPKNTPILNDAEEKLHTELGGKVADATASKEIEEKIVSERDNPAVQYELGKNYLQSMGLKEGEDVTDFYHNKKAELVKNKEDLEKEYDNYYSNVTGGGATEMIGKEKNDQLKSYENKIHELDTQIKTFDKFSGVLNTKASVENTPIPTDEKDLPNYFQTIGAKVNTLSNPDALKNHVEDNSKQNWGTWKDNVDVKNYDNEMTGIIAKQNDLVRQAKSGEITNEDYQTQSAQLESYANTALDRHIGAKIRVYGKALGQVIDDNRKDDNVVKSAWDNIFSSSPSKAETQKSIDELKAKGATFTPKEEKYFLDNPSEIQGTAILPTYVFSTADGFSKMLNPVERLLGGTKEEQKNSQETFDRSIAINPDKQFEQPETVLSTKRGDTFLKDVENPHAGDLNWGWGTGQGTAHAMATITNFIVGNKGFGAIAKAAGLGSNAALIAQNVATNVALTHDDAIKAAESFTNNKNEQEAYALITGALGGLLFAKLDPEGIVKKAFTNPSKETIKDFLIAIPKEGIKAMDKESVGNFVANTIKKAVGNNLGASALLTANEFKDVVVESLFNPKSAAKHDFNVGKTLLHNAITFGALSALHGAGGTKAEVADRDNIRQSAFEASKDIPAFKKDLDLAVSNGKISEADANEKLATITQLAQIRNSKDIPQDLSLKNQARYATNLLTENKIQSEVEGVTDKVQLDKAKEKITELQDERKELIENPKEPEPQKIEITPKEQSPTVSSEEVKPSAIEHLDENGNVVKIVSPPSIEVTKTNVNEEAKTEVTNQEAMGGSDTNNEPITSTENSEPKEGNGENTPPPNEPKEVAGGKESDKIGVHHAALTELAEKLGLPEPESIEYITPKEYADRGRTLLENGASIDEIDNKNNDLHDRISIGRAHLEKLYTELNDIRKAKGADSEDYTNKLSEIESLSTKVKKLGSAAGQAMTSLQGVRDVDTDNFEVVKRNLEEIQKHPLTIKQEKVIKKLTDQSEDLKKQVSDLEAKLIDATDKALSAKQESKSISKKGKDLATVIRKAKVHRPDSFSAGTPASIVWDGAVEIVAKSIETGAEIAQAISKGIEYIKKTDWYKSLSDDKKEEAEKDFTNWHEENARPLDDTIESLWKRFENRHDNNFSQEESKAIWNYAKKNYLDKEVLYKDMISKVSDDTGLSWRQVSAAITPKYDKYLNSTSDAMWKKRASLIRNREAVKNFIDAQNDNPLIKGIKNINGGFRGAAVFGHGGIFMGTHAGMTFFQPSRWKYTIPAFFRTWKFAYGKEANYQRAMEELRNDPNYLIAQRTGLKNNPDNINTEEFQDSQKWLSQILNKTGKVGNFFKSSGNAGIKGFNSIKVLRQQLFNAEYDQLSPQLQKNKEAVQQISYLINLATGATNLKIPSWINEVTFAGGMEAARWGKIIKSPAKAGSTVVGIIKDQITGKKTVPIEDKIFAKIWAKRVGEQIGVFGGILIANAVLQNMANPKNPVNISNPNKPDYMKFKIGDLTIDPTSGMRGTGMFMYELGKIPFTSKEEIKKQYDSNDRVSAIGKRGAGYLRGKLAPAASTLIDFISQQDFNRNPLPFSNDKPAIGKHKLSWGEYLWQKAPLPIAETAHNIYESANENIDNKATTKQILWGIMSGALSGGTGFRVGEYNAEEANHSSFTEEDKKDPTLKYFSTDWGMELPETSLSSEEITNEKKGTKIKLIDLPKETQEKYIKAHTEQLKKSLSEIKKDNSVYVKVYKDAKGVEIKEVSLNKPKHGKYSKEALDKLDTNEKAQVLKLAQSDATEKTKKQLFKAK